MIHWLAMGTFIAIELTNVSINFISKWRNCMNYNGIPYIYILLYTVIPLYRGGWEPTPILDRSCDIGLILHRASKNGSDLA